MIILLLKFNTDAMAENSIGVIDAINQTENSLRTEADQPVIVAEAGYVELNAPKKRPVSVPMSPLQASATVANLILGTGPFSYPYGFC